MCKNDKCHNDTGINKKVAHPFYGTAKWKKIRKQYLDTVHYICEECGRNMVIKYGPHGKFLACPGFPECRNTKPYFEHMYA